MPDPITSLLRKLGLSFGRRSALRFSESAAERVAERLPMMWEGPVTRAQADATRAILPTEYARLRINASNAPRPPSADPVVNAVDRLKLGLDDPTLTPSMDPERGPWYSRGSDAEPNPLTFGAFGPTETTTERIEPLQRVIDIAERQTRPSNSRVVGPPTAIDELPLPEEYAQWMANDPTIAGTQGFSEYFNLTRYSKRRRAEQAVIRARRMAMDFGDPERAALKAQDDAIDIELAEAALEHQRALEDMGERLRRARAEWKPPLEEPQATGVELALQNKSGLEPVYRTVLDEYVRVPASVPRTSDALEQFYRLIQLPGAAALVAGAGSVAAPRAATAQPSNPDELHDAVYADAAQLERMGLDVAEYGETMDEILAREAAQSQRPAAMTAARGTGPSAEDVRRSMEERPAVEGLRRGADYVVGTLAGLSALPAIAVGKGPDYFNWLAGLPYVGDIMPREGLRRAVADQVSMPSRVTGFMYEQLPFEAAAGIGHAGGRLATNMIADDVTRAVARGLNAQPTVGRGMTRREFVDNARGVLAMLGLPQKSTRGGRLGSNIEAMLENAELDAADLRYLLREGTEDRALWDLYFGKHRSINQATFEDIVDIDRAMMLGIEPDEFRGILDRIQFDQPSSFRQALNAQFDKIAGILSDMHGFGGIDAERIIDKQDLLERSGFWHQAKPGVWRRGPSLQSILERGSYDDVVKAAREHYDLSTPEGWDQFVDHITGARGKANAEEITGRMWQDPAIEKLAGGDAFGPEVFESTPGEFVGPPTREQSAADQLIRDLGGDIPEPIRRRIEPPEVPRGPQLDPFVDGVVEAGEEQWLLNALRETGEDPGELLTFAVNQGYDLNNVVDIADLMQAMQNTFGDKRGAELYLEMLRLWNREADGVVGDLLERGGWDIPRVPDDQMHAPAEYFGTPEELNLGIPMDRHPTFGQNQIKAAFSDIGAAGPGDANELFDDIYDSWVAREYNDPKRAADDGTAYTLGRVREALMRLGPGVSSNDFWDLVGLDFVSRLPPGQPITREAAEKAAFDAIEAITGTPTKLNVRPGTIQPSGRALQPIEREAVDSDLQRFFTRTITAGKRYEAAKRGVDGQAIKELTDMDLDMFSAFYNWNQMVEAARRGQTVANVEATERAFRDMLRLEVARIYKGNPEKYFGEGTTADRMRAITRAMRNITDRAGYHP